MTYAAQRMKMTMTVISNEVRSSSTPFSKETRRTPGVIHKREYLCVLWAFVVKIFFGQENYEARSL